MQVEDVDKKFVDLDQLKAADWVVARQSPAKPKRVKVGTNVVSSLNVTALTHKNSEEIPYMLYKNTFEKDKYLSSSESKIVYVNAN